MDALVGPPIGTKLGIQEIEQGSATVASDDLVVGMAERLDAAAQRDDIILERLAIFGGMDDERADHGEDILDAVIEFFVEHVLTQFGLRPFVGEQLAVLENDFDERRAVRFGELALGLGPGRGLETDGLLPDTIFRTYFLNGRGDEQMGNHWNYLDMTALGRQELWEDSPKGYPQTKPYEWWPWHDTLETGPFG